MEPETLSLLNQRVGRGWRLGLDGMRRALSKAPPVSYPVILIGGTNGKGSVCLFLHDCLQAAGLRVGMTSSPHLCDVRERMVVNGEQISIDEFDELFRQVETIADPDATYFETLALMAILYFQSRDVDAAVVEIGMGGRLDAFNALDPVVSVITTIGLEHTSHLGRTREAIAVEKAQIARAGRPAVLGCSEPALLSEVTRIGARPVLVPRREDGSAGSSRAFFREENAETAIVAAREFFAETDRGPVDEDLCRSACAIACWPGRFDVIAGSPEIILDAAHNVPAAEALVRVMRGHVQKRKVVAVVAFLSDKDVAGFFVTLDSIVDEWIVTEVNNPRAMKIADVPAPFNSVRIATVENAMTTARTAAGRAGIVLVTGSIYLLGEIFNIFKNEDRIIA